MDYTYIVLAGLNPVPWTAPSVAFKQKKVYKSAELTAYQEAVKERFEGNEHFFLGDLDLFFWFWRRLDAGTTGGRKRRGHHADATNMQKALEDALQGVLFANDRDSRKVGSMVVDQGPEVNPGVIIGIRSFEQAALDIPAWALSELAEAPILGSDDHDLDVESIF